jgi:hypothetical protein
MPNLFDSFLSLLPRDTVKVGTAVTNYSDGTCLLSTPGGGSIRVYRNSNSVVSGNKYFYKQSGIVGEAPLTLINIEVDV